MPIDLDQFSKHLRKHALPPYGKGLCSRYVRQALQASGADIPEPYAPSGKDFGPILQTIGFHEIAVDDPGNFQFMTGDVVVMQPPKGGRQDGHIAGYDGTTWISDHVQRDFWAGPEYRKQRPPYVIYRY
jgi:hypothetical protein